MKHKYINPVFLMFLFFAFGCKTIKEKDFQVSKPTLGTILPKIQTSIDLKNLKQKISYGDIKLTGYYDGVIKIKQDPDSNNLILVDRAVYLSEQKTNVNSDSIKIMIEDRNFKLKDYRMNPDKYYTKATFIQEERVNDFVKLVSSEMKRTAESDSTMNGNIQVELLSFKEKRNALLTFFSAWSLCIPALIGAPITCVKTTLELQVTIYNKENQNIGIYKAKGIGRAWIAMYWGYGSDCWRKSSLLALKNVMDKIKADIEKDRESINTKLMSN